MGWGSALGGLLGKIGSAVVPIAGVDGEELGRNLGGKIGFMKGGRVVPKGYRKGGKVGRPKKAKMTKKKPGRPRKAGRPKKK